MQNILNGLTSSQPAQDVSDLFYTFQKSMAQIQQPQKKQNLEVLFKQKKYQCTWYIAVQSLYHLATIIMVAIFLEKHHIRMIKLFQIGLISCQAFLIFFNFMLFMLLQRREFKQLRNNNFIHIQDLTTFSNVFTIMLQRFCLFKYIYIYLALLQIGLISLGIFIIKLLDNSFIIIFLITVTGARFLIEIIMLYYLQYSKKDINVAIVYSQFKIKNGFSYDECCICLSNLLINQSVNELPCDSKHRFHTKCISQWLSKHNSCPVCRIIPNYL